MRARLVSVLFTMLALAVAAHARDRDEPSLSRILPEIRRSTPGTFYDAEGPYMGADGREVYRIKWVTPDGRVVWFEADAHTGRVLRYQGNPRRIFRDPDSGGRDWTGDRGRGHDWGRGDRSGWSHGDHDGRRHPDR